METKEEVLPKKKKQALLLYMSIMFAAAFLMVAISLFVKVQTAESANQGAQENIVSLENQLENAEAAMASQAEELEALKEAKEGLETQLSESNSDYAVLLEKFSSGQAALEGANEALELKNNREKAMKSLIDAQLALAQENEEAFHTAMEAIAPLEAALDEQTLQVYHELLSYME